MPASGTWSINQRPGNGLWNPATALTFVEIINTIDVYRMPNLPLSREMIALFFFHETAFCSMSQAGGGPGVGLGQLEVLNPRSDKPAFLRSLGLTPGPALAAKIAADPRYSVELQCLYYQDKFNKGVHGRDGMLDAQIGAEPPNAWMTPKFKDAEPLLVNAMFGGSRDAIIFALNACRWYLNKDRTAIERRPITLDRYREYWDYTLPSGDILFDIRK